MSVSRSPAPSSIDLSGVPARVAEAVAQVVAVCHEQFRSDPCPEAFGLAPVWWRACCSRPASHLELDRALVAERRVPPDRIVEPVDVSSHRVLGLAAGLPGDRPLVRARRTASRLNSAVNLIPRPIEHLLFQLVLSTFSVQVQFEEPELRVRETMNALACELLGAVIEKRDDGASRIERDGQSWFRVAATPRTIMTSLGPLTYRRARYRSGASGSSPVPVDESLGLVDDYLTRPAAQLGLLMMGHCTAREGAAFFAKIGGMTPSVSTLQRLTRTMHERWETLGPETLDSIRDAEGVPHEAVSASVSLDGVMVPLRAGEDGRAEASWREAACGTVSFHDARGERLKTLYLGRMPESGKVTLKAQLASEVAHIRQLRPDVRIVAIADAAADNWTFLETLSPETEVIDFWHACEHLRTASDHAVASDWFERYREVLRQDPCGVDKVIRALRHLRDSAKPDRAEIERELAFFRKHRQRMRYHALKAEGVAIGSGVVEAANKTLVTQRMKRSGMRWRIAGGQAVLTFRALIKSARFDRAWKAIIGATDTPANDNINPCAVIAIAA